MKIKTKTGFVFEPDETLLESWEFFTAIADADSEDESRQISGARNLISVLLGKDEKRLIAHLKEKTGAASVSGVMTEVTDILSQMKTKN